MKMFDFLKNVKIVFKGCIKLVEESVSSSLL